MHTVTRDAPRGSVASRRISRRGGYYEQAAQVPTAAELPRMRLHAQVVALTAERHLCTVRARGGILVRPIPEQTRGPSSSPDQERRGCSLMAYDPSELRVIVEEQRKTIKHLRDALDDIRRSAKDSLDYSDKNHWKRNACVEKVHKKAELALEYLDNQGAKLKVKLNGTGPGQSTLSEVLR